MLVKKKRVKKLCQTCGKEFEILESRLKWGGTFCSKSCQIKRKQNKLAMVCIVCGKNYFIWPYEEKRKAPTCSIACTRNYLNEKYNQKVVCPTCKKEFWTSKKNPLKHCSMECRNKSYIGKSKTGDYNVCHTCGKKFYVELARLKRYEGIYCSRRCRDDSPHKTVEQRIMEGGLAELECAWCGKKFVRSRYFKDIQRYCSQECAKKSRNETAIEARIRMALEKFNTHFEQEKKIKKLRGKRSYFVDFFLPPNVIIECDGKFWHNPKFFPKSCNKDLVKIEYLNTLGYRVYVLKEDDIKKEADSLVMNIIKENPNLISYSLDQESLRKPEKRMIITKICKACGQKFETIPSRATNQNFCNRECKNAFHQVELNCNNCGAKFLVKRYYQYKKFCSIQCKKEFTKKKNRKNCLNCRNYFFPNPADIKRDKAKFCSKKCFVEYRYHKP